MNEFKDQSQNGGMTDSWVPVLRKDVEIIRKVHRILKAGKNAEIKLDTGGKPKVIMVSREIEK